MKKEDRKLWQKKGNFDEVDEVDEVMSKESKKKGEITERARTENKWQQKEKKERWIDKLLEELRMKECWVEREERELACKKLRKVGGIK